MRAPVRAGRFEDHRRDVATGQRLGEGVRVSLGDDRQRVVKAVRDTDRVWVRVVGVEPADDQVVPAVEVVVQLHHALATGVGARESQRHHRRLRTGAGEADPFTARHHLQHLLAPRDLEVVRRPEMGAASERPMDRLDHLGTVVAK